MRPLLLSLALLAPAVATAQPIDRSLAAARLVVQRYYAAIDHGDYATAWRLWDRGGQASGKTLDAFTRGFARTAHTRVLTGAPTDGEGAAGSVFVTIPVQVDATLKNGARQHFAGSYILRRVDDVDGASPEQLRWHLATASLRPVR
jgi:hypothetical protein